MILVSLYTSFHNVGGAQKMCLSIHNGLLNQLKPCNHFICSGTEYKDIHSDYFSLINKEHYIKLSAFNMKRLLNNAIVISHHRKISSQLVLTQKFFKIKTKIIHVAHNEFSSLRRLTFFPDIVVAVSERVKSNHQNYFNLTGIKVIHNGIEKPKTNSVKQFDQKSIKILIPGRITKVKQQVEIVKALKLKLPPNITLYFAGQGPDLDNLKTLTQGDSNFNCLGHVSDMHELYQKVDFIMLFSLKEGLPLSLIEANSYGKPILCNDVGGNYEILKNGFNGFAIDSLNNIETLMARLSQINIEKYQVLSRNSLHQFQNKFSFKTMIDSYINVIKAP